MGVKSENELAVDIILNLMGRDDTASGSFPAFSGKIVYLDSEVFVRTADRSGWT
jgi:hypothetical protein